MLMISAQQPIDRPRLQRIRQNLAVAVQRSGDAKDDYGEVTGGADSYTVYQVKSAFESAADDTYEKDSSGYGEQAADGLYSLSGTRRQYDTAAGEGRQAHQDCDRELNTALLNSNSGIPKDLHDKIQEAVSELRWSNTPDGEVERTLSNLSWDIERAQSEASDIRDDQPKDDWSEGRDVSDSGRDGLWNMSSVEQGFSSSQNSANESAGVYGNVQSLSAEALRMADSYLEEGFVS